MNKNLAEIAKVMSGYSFRGAVPANKNGRNKVIQVRDIDDIYLDSTSIETFSDIDKAVVKDGDILLAMRGTESSGLKVDMVEGQKDQCMASSSLCILRIANNTVLPEYLLFYLGSSCGQQRLKSLLAGATVKTIVKKELANLQIPIPSIRKQKQVIQIAKNIYKQQQLLSQKNTLLAIVADNIISTHS